MNTVDVPPAGLEWVACPLCGTARSRTWLTAGDVEFGGSETFHLVHCPDCGFTFLNPRPTASEIGRYYPAGYYTHAAMTEAAARRAYAPALDLVERHGLPGPLLDVGAGDGALLAQLVARGWTEVSGVEPDAGAQRVAAEQRGLAVVHGTFPDAVPLGRTFSTLTMLEVIEHLHDPGGALVAVRELLRPGGRLVLTTPNVDALEPRLLGARAVSLQVPRHLSFFNARTMAELLVRSGLRPVVVTTGGNLSGLTRSLWLARRRDGASAGPLAVAYHPSSWRRRVHESLDVVLAPAAWLAQRTGRGSTLLVVAERPADG